MAPVMIFPTLVWGKYLSSRDVECFELALVENPTDLSARLQLIGYYEYYKRDRRTQLRQWEHVFWMVENRSSDWACYYFGVPKSKAKKEYLKKLWLGQTRKQNRNWNVLCNAANSMAGIEDKVGVALFRKALRLRPRLGLPARRLAQHYRGLALHGPKRQRATSARRAFEFAELTLRQLRGWIKLKGCQ
jgi:hypothetical protein